MPEVKYLFIPNDDGTFEEPVDGEFKVIDYNECVVPGTAAPEPRLRDQFGQFIIDIWMGLGWLVVNFFFAFLKVWLESREEERRRAAAGQK